MLARVRTQIERRPLIAAVVYTGTGLLPLYLVSSQVLQIDRDLGFGVAQLAIATATYTGASAISAGASGGLVSRRGPSVGFRIGVALTIVACLLAAGSPVGWLIPVATAIGGVGNGLTQVGANVAIFDGVGARRLGAAYGAKQSAVPLASVAAGLSLPLIGLALGWRWGFVLAAALATALLAVAPDLDQVPAQSRAETKQGPLPSALVPLAIAGIAGAMAGNGIALFVVPSAVDIGIEEGVAGAVLAVCSLLVVAVRVGAGWLVDRRAGSGYREMIALTLAGGLGALVLMVAATPSAYLLAIPIALLGTWGWPGVFFFTVVQSFPSIPARASAVVLAGNLTGTLIGPVVVGLYAGQGDYEGAWRFVALTALVSGAAFSGARIRSRDVVRSTT